MKNLSLSVVLPAYNEEANIEKTILDALNFLAKHLYNFEVIVVNDGSSDETAQKVNRLAQQYPGYVKLINNEKNLGYGATVAKGLKSAEKDWVFFTDSDGQFDISELINFFPLTNSADFIVGQRVNRQDPSLRKLNAGCFNLAVRTFFQIPIKDIDCAFKLMRKTILDKINLETTGALINTELIYKAKRLGAKIAELPVNHYERIYGTPTGGDPRVIFKAIKEFWKLRYSLFLKETNFLSLNTNIVALFAVLAGFIAFYYSFTSGTILAYGDAEAHLNLAKKVISSLTPGFSQIGGVWLPLTHILMLPLIWNDVLWRTGVAGSIPSLIGFVFSAIILYKLSYLITKNYLASFIAPLVLITNPNALYLATTPMSETLLFTFVTSSFYFFLKWVYKEEVFSLVWAAFFAMCASLTRYDGWFLVCLQILIVWIVTYIRNRNFKKAEGYTILYGVLAFLGIGLWLLWNLLIFGNALYFANSEYGSKAQQMWFYAKGLLPTYKNLPLSLLYYITDSRLNLGNIISTLTVGGLVIYIINLFRSKFTISKLAPLLLFFSLGFYTVSLYTGQASIILPTYAQDWYPWTLSNVRYGVQMLLPAAIFVAYLASKVRFSSSLIIGLILLQSFIFLRTGDIIAYQDGVGGLSSQIVSKGEDALPAEKWIAENYDGGLVLMDDYRRPISLVNSKIPMQNFIGVGNKPYWQESLDNPTKHAQWIIIQKADTDVVWTQMKNKQILDDHFVNVFRSGNIWIYKQREQNNADFVKKSGQNLVLQNEIYKFNGVNIYDLLTHSHEDIVSLMSSLEKNNINTIRAWGFDKNSKLTDQEFENLDFILQQADRRGFKLILVLGNQWEDYGGRNTYVSNRDYDSFYTDPQSKQNFKDYIKSVLTHQNSLTSIQYKDDPAIMIWEILNEPRLEWDKSGDILSDWTEEMGQYIASLDNKHLISVGTEGFLHDGNTAPYQENHGADYLRICRLSVIDVCSAHLYPKYFPTVPNNSDLEKVLGRWQDIASQASKPFYIGEVGFDLATATDQNNKYAQREQLFQDVHNVVERKNISGALIWNISLSNDNYFTISFKDTRDQNILNNWN